MQNKTTVGYHLIPSEWLFSVSQQNTSAGEDREKKEPSCTVGGNANWCSHYGKQHAVSSKNLK